MKRVLVVDDDEDLRELITHVLAREFEVVEADRGEQALALLSNGEFDAVVLDYMMPGLDGADLIARARAEGHALPIVLTSAAIGRGEAMAMGADDFVPKPFDVAELAERVERAAA